MNTNETNMKEQNLEALKKYATNLIEQARAGRLDAGGSGEAVAGREGGQGWHHQDQRQGS